MKREDLFRIFNDCRIKRNLLIYYGKKLDFELAEENIKRIDNLISELSLLIDEESISS